MPARGLESVSTEPQSHGEPTGVGMATDAWFECNAQIYYLCA
jgi:hypothetical protein